MFEALESRSHFDGVINITITEAAISVRGTDGHDFIRIEGTSDFGGEPDYGYYIETNPDVKLVVNGEPYVSPGGFNSFRVSVDSPNWNKPLRIDLGAGDDIVASGLAGVQQMSVKLGPGDDRLYTRHSGSGLSVDGGTGDDRINLAMTQDFNIRNVALYPEQGRDRVVISALIEFDTDGIAGKLLINDSQGPTGVTLTNLRVKRETLIRTAGRSIDHVTLNGCRFLRPIVIQTSGGRDSITADAATSFVRPPVVGANDDDDIVVGF